MNFIIKKRVKNKEKLELLNEIVKLILDLSLKETIKLKRVYIKRDILNRVKEKINIIIFS